MKTILCILDGFGIRPFDQANALRLAKNWRFFLKKYSWISLEASSKKVGLPEGQMGNSEVGHMTMGCGQVFFQDLPRLNEMFQKNEILSYIPKGKETCHIMGLLSPGGVHSHEDHFFETIKLISQTRPIWCHIFLDGRDTPPKSALDSLEKLLQIKNVRIATVMGRFYAMDRDNRMERTAPAYNAIIKGKGHVFKDIISCIESFYEKDITDEFIPPCVHEDYKGKEKDDSFFMVNFRADRVRQILSELLKNQWSWCLGTSTYGIDMPSILKPYEVNNSLGDIVSKAGLKQLRIAETEKYAHVTFFFNGGKEEPFENEDRIIVSSPKVRTYDEKPEMAAYEITEKIIEIVNKNEYDLIIVNYANADMVGHTGIVPAIEKAIMALDDCLKKLEETVLKNKWCLVITSDHGNAEFMFEEDGSPHTAHTCSLVPFMVIGHPSYKPSGKSLKDIKKNIINILEI